MSNHADKIALVSYWDDIQSIIPILKKYRAIFATEQAAVALSEAGITLDTVISDFDSIANRAETIKELKEKTNVEVLPAEKDMSDTRAMVDFMLTKYPEADIDIFNTFDGRVDHALALISLFSIAPNILIYTKQASIRLLSPGVHKIPCNSKYTYISFIAIEELHNFELRDFKYDTKKPIIPIFSDFLLSNELLENQVGTVSFTKGKTLLIFSRDKK